MKTSGKGIAIVLLAIAGVPHPMPAFAQSYTIHESGQPTVYVRPSPGGDFTVHRAGQSPTYVRRSGSGSATVTATDIVRYLPLESGVKKAR